MNLCKFANPCFSHSTAIPLRLGIPIPVFEYAQNTGGTCASMDVTIALFLFHR